MASSILERLGETIQVTRPSAPVTYIKGRAVAGSSTTFPVTGVSVQPLRPDELQALPELSRTSETRKFYLTTELFVVDAATQTAADLILWNSKIWKVISVANHSEGLLNHFKVIAQRTTKA